MIDLRRSSQPSTCPRVWLDIDNPPQVQYLFPFKAAFEARGFEVVITVREYGNAVELLQARTSDYHVVGRAFGASRLSKASGTLRRARQLMSLFRELGRPDVLLAASRPAAVVARRFGIPSFIVGDYEFANAGFYRYTGSTILHPSVIDPASFIAQGMPADRLIPFEGLKEDITFSGIDIGAVPAWDLKGHSADGTVKVLVRPPAEKSHYYAEGSRTLSLAVLWHLSGREDATVVFAPRYPEQLDDLRSFEWRNPPIVLEEGIPFLSLLKAIDLVVCSGGTILREAAYLGIPAYSTFQSRLGDVDGHLAQLGRVHVLSGREDVHSIELRTRGPLDPLRTNPGLLEEIVELVETRLSTRPRTHTERLHASAASTDS